MLYLKAALFTAIMPGTFGLYLPYLIAKAGRHQPFPPITPSTAAAYLLLVLGFLIYLRCAWDFVFRGAGTPAPVEPPKCLVVHGLYRCTRNPMYNGVLLAVLSEAWLARSVDVLLYAACLLLGFHLFVVLYEEPQLIRRFGPSYTAYRRAVPRWGFTFRPYRSQDGTT